MKILITGATGFVGSHLTKALLKSKRNHLILLIRKSSKLTKIKDIIEKNKSRVDIIYGDLNDYSALLRATKGTDIVFHSAAMLGSPEINFRQIHEANVLGTKNLVEASELNKVKRFVHISSVAVYGPIKYTKDNPITETTKCNPLTDYDKTKFLSEVAVKKSSLEWTIIRPTMVFGPGETTNKAKMFQLIQKGWFKIIGNGENLMALVYIDNLIDGIIKASKSKKAVDETYVISDDHSYTMNQFIYTIAKHINVKKPVHIPYVIAATSVIGFKVLSLFGVPKLLSMDRIRSLTNHAEFSIAKAKSELKYNPKIDLDKGIKRTVDWYKKNKVLK
jgi:nucleoside-diphosphate-sugar epimerase